MPTFGSKTDQDIVAHALRGSADAYRELVLRFQRPVLSIIHRMVQDVELAEDISQEVFLKAYRKLGQYDPSRKLSSWLFKIAHNTTIDYLRRKRVDTVPLEAESDDGESTWEVLKSPESQQPDRQTQRSEIAEGLEQAMNRLKPAYREVLQLRFGQGLQYDEIAEVTGLKMGTVKIHLHRARKLLATELSRRGLAPTATSAQSTRETGSKKSAKHNPKRTRRVR